MGISSTSLHSILREHFAVKRICSRWIPQKLTITEKKVHIDGCIEILEKYDGGASEDFYEIVTGDELWIYAYEPKTKQKSTL